MNNSYTRVVYDDGTVAYYLNNIILHREDGPAIIHSDGHNSWFYHGKMIPCSSQQEFEKLLKLKALW